MDRIRTVGHLASWRGTSGARIGGKPAVSSENDDFGPDIGPIFSF
jgi:hypothetical protein